MKRIVSIFGVLIIALCSCTTPVTSSMASETSSIVFSSSVSFTQKSSILEIRQGETIEFSYDNWAEVEKNQTSKVIGSSTIYIEGNYLYFLTQKSSSYQVCRRNLQSDEDIVLFTETERIITSFLVLNENELLLLCEVDPTELLPEEAGDGSLPAWVYVVDLGTGEKVSFSEKYDIEYRPVWNIQYVDGNIFFDNYFINDEEKVVTCPDSIKPLLYSMQSGRLMSDTLFQYQPKTGKVLLYDKNVSAEYQILTVSGFEPNCRIEGDKAYFYYDSEDQLTSTVITVDLEAKEILQRVEHQWPAPLSVFEGNYFPYAGGYCFVKSTRTDEEGVRPEFSQVQLFYYDADGALIRSFPPFEQHHSVYHVDFVLWDATVYYIKENRPMRISTLATLSAT